MARKSRDEVSRAFTKDWKGPINRLALPAGQIIWVSNYLHSYLHVVFRWSVGDDAMADALWHEQRNDGPQRGLLLAALDANTTFKADDKARFVWVIKKADKLAELRNDLIHLPTLPYSIFKSASFAAGKRRTPVKVGLLPSLISTPPARLARVTAPGWEKSIRLLRGDMLALARYVAAVWGKAVGLHKRPLPRKPRLRLAPDAKAKKRPKGPAPQRQP